MQYLAPTGTKISLKDKWKWFTNFIIRNDIRTEFSELVKKKFNKKFCFFFGTGRTGMAFLLKALFEIDNYKRNEIIVPSYTCYSVPASAEFAGLKVRVIDINPKTLDYNYQELEKNNFENVLAIISSNLYGIPNDITRLESIANQNKVYLVDDSAQSMGAKSNHKYTGTYGDAGLFSLDKGKNITSLDGGIVITNSTIIAEKLEACYSRLHNTGLINQIIYIVKVFFYSIFLKPSLYWIPNNLPFLKLGQTLYEPKMPLFRYDKIHASLGIEMFKQLDKITAHRKKTGLLLKTKLKELPGIFIPESNQNSEGVFLRLPVLVDESLRDKLITALNRKGIGATASYPKSLMEVPEVIKNCNVGNSSSANGIIISKELITLPTHQFVSKKHINIIYNTFKQYLN